VTSDGRFVAFESEATSSNSFVVSDLRRHDPRQDALDERATDATIWRCRAPPSDGPPAASSAG
jgi:hypothetical protein